MLGLPAADVVDLDQEVGVSVGLGGEVEYRCRTDQSARGHRRDVGAVLAADPVVRCVEVRAGVLAGTEVVPVPSRPAVVVPADLIELELCGLPELRR